jgi:uncharacterized membrane protein YbhN (UPF0104 family)
MAAQLSPISRTRMRRAIRSPRFRAVIQLVAGLGILIAVIARVGTGPLLHGVASLDWRTIGAALVLAAVATAAAAWRWRLIANRLGVGLRWSTAIGLYYQSQFLNTVLPGGIIGDAHRAVSHGSRTENVEQTARSVAIERTAGQVVQLTVGLAVAAVFGAEFVGYMLSAIAIGVAVVGAAVIVTIAVSSRGRRLLRRELAELQAGLGSVRDCLKVTAASVIVIACHIATFSIATAAVGESVPVGRMLVLAFVVLLGASIPLNFGGWGPREGIAGWAFTLAGFGATAGVAASTLFGALTMISVAPGAVIMIVNAVGTRRAAARKLQLRRLSGVAESPAVRAESRALVLAATSQEKSS